MEDQADKIRREANRIRDEANRLMAENGDLLGQAQNKRTELEDVISRFVAENVRQRSNDLKEKKSVQGRGAAEAGGRAAGGDEGVLAARRGRRGEGEQRPQRRKEHARHAARCTFTTDDAHMPNQQRTPNKLPTELRCRNFVNKHRLSLQMCTYALCIYIQLSFHFAYHRWWLGARACGGKSSAALRCMLLSPRLREPGHGEPGGGDPGHAGHHVYRGHDQGGPGQNRGGQASCQL